MKLEIDLRISWPATPPAWLLEPLAAIARMETKMSDLTDAVTALQAEVAAETTVEQSAVTLLNGIPALITTALAQAGVDATAAAAAVKSVTDAITASSTSLAAAVTANTPAAPH